jgi:hypothetical protein
MSTIVHVLPGIACGALMCIPMIISRRWLRRRGAPGSPTASAPKAPAGLLKR